MGENTEITRVQQSPTDRMQREIRHTEAHISETVHAIEDRLSPSNIKRRALRRARSYMWKGIANALDFIQRRPGQTALAGTGAVLLMVFGKKKGHERTRTATRMEIAGSATRAFLSGARGKASKEASRSGMSFMWRGLGTALGAAIGTYLYNRRSEPAPPLAAARGTEPPRAGAYPGMTPTLATHPSHGASR